MRDWFWCCWMVYFAQELRSHRGASHQLHGLKRSCGSASYARLWFGVAGWFVSRKSCAPAEAPHTVARSIGCRSLGLDSMQQLGEISAIDKLGAVFVRAVAIGLGDAAQVLDAITLRATKDIQAVINK